MKLFHKLRKTSAASIGITGGADGPSGNNLPAVKIVATGLYYLLCSAETFFALTLFFNFALCRTKLIRRRLIPCHRANWKA